MQGSLRTHGLQLSIRRSCPRTPPCSTRASARRQRAGAMRRQWRRQEAEWEGELDPGNDAARPPPLASVQLRRAGGGDEQQPESNAAAELLHSVLGRHWEALPSRYKLVFATAMAFVLCNMDKVNISVAIIPMAQDFGWSPTVSGLVQSSFFFGYMLSQIPGGYVVSRAGGRKILPLGVGLWSAATAAVPLLAGSMPGLFATRAAVGLGEGVAPSSATDMVARTIADSERSRAMSFIFGGLHVGSLAGLLVAPALIERFGWATVFYAFGGLGGYLRSMRATLPAIAGVAWSMWFEQVQAGIAEADPDVAAELAGIGRFGRPADAAPSAADDEATPWRAFLRSTPVRALAYTHFCNNWFHYTMMAWLPSYFADTLQLNLGQAAQLSLLPPVAAIVASSMAGTAGDALIERGVPVVRVRKLAQAIAFLLPAACLAGASLTEDSVQTVGLITAALGLASFSLAGLYCNHADLSPRHAPVLLGLTNTSGAIPGIIGVTISGAILDQTGSWDLALFAPSAFFFVTGAAVFTIWGSSDRQDFSNNSPFAWEAQLHPLTRRLEGVRAAAAKAKPLLASAQATASPALHQLQHSLKKLRELLQLNRRL